MDDTINQDRKILASRLKRLREKLGLSQQELADQSGLSRVHISGLERGVSSPAVESLVRIAKVLQTSAGELLKDIEVSNTQFHPESNQRVYPELQAFLDDPDTITLYNLKPEEVALLKSIRFQSRTFQPSRQFFVSALLEIRRKKITE